MIPWALRRLEELGSERPPVHLRAERCLRWRHRRAPCRRCLEFCPTGALTEGRPVMLDLTACSACGLCLHRCPAGALEPGSALLEELLRSLPSLAGERVALACPQADDEEGRSRLPVGAVVQVPCLGWVTPSLLLHASEAGLAEVWLDDSPCPGCAQGAPVTGELAAGLALAGGLLRRAGRALPLVRASAPARRLRRRPRAVRLVDPRQPRINRRELFTRWGHVLTQGVSTTVAARLTVSEEPPPPSARLPHYLPAERRRLLEVLARWGEPARPPAGLPGNAIRLEGDCRACGLCARFCPGGAIRFHTEEDRFHLTFRPALCLGEDCLLCLLACPEEALASTAAEDPFSPREHLLLVGGLAPCRRCGAPCNAALGELCYVCRQAEKRAPAGLGDLWPAGGPTTPANVAE